MYFVQTAIFHRFEYSLYKINNIYKKHFDFIKKIDSLFSINFKFKIHTKENLYDLLVMVNRTKVEKNPLDLKIEYS